MLHGGNYFNLSLNKFSEFVHKQNMQRYSTINSFPMKAHEVLCLF